eukprot:gene31537-biopygen20260
MKVTPRRKRSDSAAAAIAATQAAALGPLEPPAHVTLRPGDRPFWNAIMLARARDTWTEVDLTTAATLARTQADIEDLHATLAAAALGQWRAAAQLRPQDQKVLSAWFKTALLWPESEDFHRAARRIFRLPATDPATLALQHASYKTYLDQAKPGARLKPDDMARLARRFARIREFGDADKLCRILLKTAPDHAELPDTLSACANGLLHAGERDRAVSLLPDLLRLAPNDMVTRALQRA